MSETQATVSTPAASTTTTTAPDWGGANPGDFHSLIPQEYRAEPAFQNFKGAVKDVAPKFFKSALEAQRLVGAPPEQIVRLPKADADPALWDQVWTRLGRPDSPDKYELKPPDGLTISPKLDAVARSAFHKAGVSAKAAQQIYQEFTAGQKAEYDSMMAERKAESAKTETTFKAKWGDKFDEQMRTAKTAFDQLLTPDLKKIFTSSGLDSHPDMIALMNKLGHTLKGDTMLGGDGGSANQTRDMAAVQAETVKVMDELSKMKDRLAPEYKTKKAQLDKLFTEGAELKYANQ